MAKLVGIFLQLLVLNVPKKQRLDPSRNQDIIIKLFYGKEPSVTDLQ
jgi:hypothetical protein